MDSPHELFQGVTVRRVAIESGAKVSKIGVANPTSNLEALVDADLDTAHRCRRPGRLLGHRTYSGGAVFPPAQVRASLGGGFERSRPRSARVSRSAALAAR